MKDIVFLSQAILALGLFHGLRGEHLLAILHSEKAPSLYESPGLISLKVSLLHLGYILCLGIPLLFFKEGFPGLSRFPFHFMITLLLLFLCVSNIYTFFKCPPKLLHQHAHPHEHMHTHEHDAKLKAISLAEHPDHFHPIPCEIDSPRPLPCGHAHTHLHQHEHLHFHTRNGQQGHSHQHPAGLYYSFRTPHNCLFLLALTLSILIFPLAKTILIFTAYLLGLFLALYLFGVFYRGKGIPLMEKLIRLSTLLLGLLEGSIGLWLL